MNNILCTICARGGSKGVKNKNIRMLNGKPLIAYTIEQALGASLFEHVVVSTDSDAIADVAVKYGAEVFFRRPPELASDTAGKLDVIKDAFLRSEKYYNRKFDYLIDLDATAPLRKKSDIINAFNLMLENKNNNLITGVKARKSPYFNQVELDEGKKVRLCKKIDRHILRRQDSPSVFDMNASIYIWERDFLLFSESVIGDNTGIYIMNDISMFDIDSELDFKIVEFLMKEYNYV